MLQDPLTLALILVVRRRGRDRGHWLPRSSLARTSPERRRLRETGGRQRPSIDGPGSGAALTDRQDDMVQARLDHRAEVAEGDGAAASGGWRGPAIKQPAEGRGPVRGRRDPASRSLFALATIAFMGLVRGGHVRAAGAGVGYALPGLWLARKTAQRQKEIQNGLPDALDLLIVCVEAGAGLDRRS